MDPEIQETEFASSNFPLPHPESKLGKLTDPSGAPHQITKEKDDLPSAVEEKVRKGWAVQWSNIPVLSHLIRWIKKIASTISIRRGNEETYIEIGELPHPSETARKQAYRFIAHSKAELNSLLSGKIKYNQPSDDLEEILQEPTASEQIQQLLLKHIDDGKLVVQDDKTALLTIPLADREFLYSAWNIREIGREKENYQEHLKANPGWIYPGPQYWTRSKEEDEKRLIDLAKPKWRQAGYNATKTQFLDDGSVVVHLEKTQRSSSPLPQLTFRK